MDARTLGAGSIEDVQPIGGGTQNQVLRYRRGAEHFVLRSGPPNPRPASDETMRREVRVIRALSVTGVPVPIVLASEDDPTILGGAFYIMSPVKGHSIMTGLDHLDRVPSAKRRLGFAMVDSLAAIRAVDYGAIGLDGFGRPAGFLERQVRRWSEQLRSYSQMPGYSGRGVDLEPIEAWLIAHRRAESSIGVIHGDFHIGNVLFGDDGEVAAVVDWELSTIGDPMLDLGQLLATWPSPNHAAGFAGFVPGERASGFATTDELIERYGAATGCDLADLDWYRVLAAYRLGVLLEGTQARADSGLASPEVGRLLHESAVSLGPPPSNSSWVNVRRVLVSVRGEGLAGPLDWGVEINADTLASPAEVADMFRHPLGCLDGVAGNDGHHDSSVGPQ